MLADRPVLILCRNASTAPTSTANRQSCFERSSRRRIPPRLRAPRRQHGESSKKETARKTLFAERVSRTNPAGDAASTSKVFDELTRELGIKPRSTRRIASPSFKTSDPRDALGQSGSVQSRARERPWPELPYYFGAAPSCGRGRVECACVCVSGRQTSGGIAEEATLRPRAATVASQQPSARGIHFSLPKAKAGALAS
jgi:hypothetical protein